MTLAEDRLLTYGVRQAPMSWSQRQRQAVCARKVRHDSWEEAREAGLAVSRENPKGVNPPTPYPCSVSGEPHYHCGHMSPESSRGRWRRRKREGGR